MAASAALVLTATLLVLLAGLTHATWNLISKRTRAGADFVMLYSAMSATLLSPVALVASRGAEFQFDGRALACVLASGSLHFVYALLLQKGYQASDLAIVYPTARGSGPLLSTMAAVLLLREAPTAGGVSGALLVICGIFLIGSAGGAAATHDAARTRRGILFGLATGVCIAGYTVVDAISVKTVKLPPVVVDYLSNLTRTMILLPAIVMRRGQLAQSFQRHRTAAIAVAALSPLSYIIVLYAMKIAPVSHIAPMREVSVLFGVSGAALFLGEPFGWRRVAGAAAIATGVVLLSVA